jgi:hypothetical protein
MRRHELADDRGAHGGSSFMLSLKNKGYRARSPGLYRPGYVTAVKGSEKFSCFRSLAYSYALQKKRNSLSAKRDCSFRAFLVHIPKLHKRRRIAFAQKQIAKPNSGLLDRQDMNYLKQLLLLLFD